MKQRLRVVIDTNVVVAAIIFRAGRLAWLREAWGAALTPIVSSETLTELVRVLRYPKFGLDAEEQKAALTLYVEFAETLANPSARAKLPECRDSNDEIFLRLAYAAKADALVSGDADLLVLADKSRIPILSPAELRVELNKVAG